MNNLIKIDVLGLNVVLAKKECERCDKDRNLFDRVTSTDKALCEECLHTEVIELRNRQCQQNAGADNNVK
ncbi:uncharacterized protein EbC_20060 [Erwinia billingiae Eb661]|jgi:hypothetical protein|uniref:Uncharacterized protein n=1 Tax=Erwinia billingiae (strain Eb661) TaxID=634500 RepID=D8MRT0_ERWBE|nr:uncharacterized protein EbC_20060 [Erwinia billingiae Eb661]